MIRTCIAKATAVAALTLGIAQLLTPATVASAPSATTRAASAPAPRTVAPYTGTWGG